MGRVIHRWKERTRQFRLEFLVLYLACRDPRTPRAAKMVAAGVVAYALSPLDLIPDPLPLVGYLDDLAVLLVGLALVPRMIPAAILAECRARAGGSQGASVRWVATGILVANWVITALAIGYLTMRKAG
jgi:uncharacterized membrane protein YkvA (DUF1232 family)